MLKDEYLGNNSLKLFLHTTGHRHLDDHVDHNGDFDQNYMLFTSQK